MLISETKIRALDELAERASALREEGKTIVLCHGTFDLIHIGHIRHLQQARSQGDALFVTLTADQFVTKGPGRPVFNEQLRLENLAALACVDYVAVVNHITALPAIEAVRPHLYVKGSDYKNHEEDLTGNIRREVEAVQANGGRLLCTDDITFSSSKLLNQHFNVFSDEARDYLERLRSTFSADDIIDKVRCLKGMKVCVVGDIIVDEYHYTDLMGQTGKGNIMAARHKSSELFAGGSAAVANHIAGFSENVTLVGGLGRQNSHEAFIREKLHEAVEPVFFYREDAPTVCKSRFVDGDTNKLFEVYYYQDSAPAKALENEIIEWMARELDKFDVVVVPDFGNGFITRAMVDALCTHAKFLAVNTQINSGNRGFHTINRYRRADFISLNEPELRMAVHNRSEPVENLARNVAERLGAAYIATTLGTRGLYLSDMENGDYVVPALSIKVVDRVGAGDAFLSLASICLAGGIEPQLAAFVGAAAAAIDVQIVCNRECITPTALFKYLVTLLK